MKTTNTLTKILIVLITAGASILSGDAAAQNLIVNPGFQSGTSGWSTDCSMELYAETVYGGIDAANTVTEIDVERCFNQQVPVSPNVLYDFSFDATRRTGGGTPAEVGVNVTITGVESGTEYLNVNKTYSNTVWGFVTESFSFTMPSNATDTKVNIKFSNYATTGTYGTIVDNVDFHIDAQSVILPVRLMSFSGVVTNNSAVLRWTATNDDNEGKSFIVERAGASGGFDSIGVVTAGKGTAYLFTDNKLLNGSNNYRLKIVSRASSVYSKIINLDNAMNFGVQLYPNPAVAAIGLKLNSAARNTVNIVVYNISGSVVSIKTVQLNAGINTVSIDVTSLHSGSFFLKVSDGREISYVQAFIKK